MINNSLKAPIFNFALTLLTLEGNLSNLISSRDACQEQWATTDYFHINSNLYYVTFNLFFTQTNLKVGS